MENINTKDLKTTKSIIIDIIEMFLTNCKEIGVLIPQLKPVDIIMVLQNEKEITKAITNQLENIIIDALIQNIYEISCDIVEHDTEYMENIKKEFDIKYSFPEIVKDWLFYITDIHTGKKNINKLKKSLRNELIQSNPLELEIYKWFKSIFILYIHSIKIEESQHYSEFSKFIQKKITIRGF